MKIGDKIPPIRIDAYVQQAQEKPRPKGPEANTFNAALKDDKVELSQTAKDINRLKEQLDSVPDVREEKVADIKNRIDTGTYKADGKKIAFNMVRESLINEIV